MSSNSVPSTNLAQVYSPERWAMESVAILFENAVASQLVNRDFQDDFQSFGDVVNTRKPNPVQANRKAPGDSVVKKAASSTNIPVKLNQHLESTFFINDEDQAKSFKNLVEEFLRPHTIALASMLDNIVIGQYINFIENQSGTLGGLDTTNAVEYITEGGLVLDDNKVPAVSRQAMWSARAKATIIQNAVFHEADKRGDTVGLRRASIGEQLNFTHWMDQNVAQLAEQTTVTEAVNGDQPEGTTSLTVTSLTADVDAGAWVSINGKVYQVATDAVATDTTLVLTYGLREAVANADDILVYPQGQAVDLAAGYAEEYNRAILIDNGSGAQPSDTPRVGQVVSFGANQNYTIVRVDDETTEYGIWLDRPLESALSDDDPVYFGATGGGFNPMFHTDAITLAVRPLQPVMTGAGAVSSTISFNGLTIRVTISYNNDVQQHQVTLDFLAGVKVLDEDKGGVILT